MADLSDQRDENAQIKRATVFAFKALVDALSERDPDLKTRFIQNLETHYDSIRDGKTTEVLSAMEMLTWIKSAVKG